MVWLGIDGIDCTGKTTAVEILRKRNVGQLGQPVIEQEFSNSRLGDMIKSIISQYRFFSLTDPPSSRCADGLVILADHVFKLESAFLGRSRFVVSDRCHLSVIGYQVARAKLQYGNELGNALGDLMSDFHGALLKRQPDLRYISVLLTITPGELNARLKQRGEQELNDEQMEFLMRAQEDMLAVAPDEVIPVGDKSPFEVADALVGIIVKHAAGLAG